MSTKAGYSVGTYNFQHFSLKKTTWYRTIIPVSSHAATTLN